ncbi:hypothetical protein J2125_003242 [Erwinia toletana]|uniref:Uncharacterized protein n=1 Tax=Winslowiella toletana TaxID=92490 RepID=A0ABS4PD57_9GAMM|nr:hypothetical protein [Winslowiella toletana]MBP2170050.1 hypothetical protein [Winslowiella toletana]
MKCPQVWHTTNLPAMAMAAILLSPLAMAETVTVSLSQEQDGGDMGRACIYVHQGKAEFRMVKAGEQCAPNITIDNNKA